VPLSLVPPAVVTVTPMLGCAGSTHCMTSVGGVGDGQFGSSGDMLSAGRVVTVSGPPSWATLACAWPITEDRRTAIIGRQTAMARPSARALPSTRRFRWAMLATF
jgi:hypothetical protein